MQKNTKTQKRVRESRAKSGAASVVMRTPDTLSSTRINIRMFFEGVSLGRRADFLADARDDAKRQILCAFSELHRRTRPRDGEMEF
jgi:hypothetical protein